MDTLPPESGLRNGRAANRQDFARLYRRAFAEFGASALWSSRPVPDPTPADALAITQSLRVEGNLQARRLAEEIEQACRAAKPFSPMPWQVSRQA
jgi:hypothetical protein